jgi:uncharacterized repeat protein (TIGR02543 family)
MAAKIFEVGDVLPATTQLRIYFNINSFQSYYTDDIKTFNNSQQFFYYDNDFIYSDLISLKMAIYNRNNSTWVSPFTSSTGNHNYIDINISHWSVNKRTISRVDEGTPFTWEDLNPPQGYTITFNSNGGSSVSDITEATELPTPLPTPTKSGYTFVNWYYDSAFTQIATAGDTIESNVTLYAKWELNTYTITYNSNGGSSVPQISNATQLPSELPIPTKERNTFVGWYYDSTLKQKAKPNDMINTNITLYAKWYDSLSAFYTDIANLIREFENSSDNIKVTDFADRLRALLESV